MGIFTSFFFTQYKPGKCLLPYSRLKNAFLGYKSTSSNRGKNDIFSHGFGPKMAIFQPFFCFGNIEKENVFYDILERKNAFLGYKNKNFKKSKNSRFWSKNGHFNKNFILANTSQENVYYVI